MEQTCAVILTLERTALADVTSVYLRPHMFTTDDPWNSPLPATNRVSIRHLVAARSA